MLRYLFFFLLTALPLTGHTQSVISLEEAIRLSLENNYQLKQAENNLALADARARSAFADFLPALNASLNGNRNTGQQFSQELASLVNRTTLGMSGGFNTNLPIFTGFQNINNLRRSRVNQELEAVTADRIRETIIFNTAMQYLQVLLDEQLLGIAVQNLETARIQLRQVEAQVEVGSRPMVDLYQQQSIVARTELQLVQAQNALDLSRIRLVRTLQLDPEAEFELVAPPIDETQLVPAHMDLQEMIRLALANRKDLQMQELQIQASRYTLEMARSNLYPTLTANASFNTRYSDQYRLQGVPVSFSDQFFDQMISRSVGFSLNIPLFNRLNNRTNIEQARVQYRNARLELEDINYEVREEISQAYNDYNSLAKELEATERALRAAEQAYRTQEQRYEVGAASLIELNQATTDYMQAQSDRQRALYNFIFQEKLLDYYIGRLDENISF